MPKPINYYWTTNKWLCFVCISISLCSNTLHNTYDRDTHLHRKLRLLCIFFTWIIPRKTNQINPPNQWPRSMTVCNAHTLTAFSHVRMPAHNVRPTAKGNVLHMCSTLPKEPLLYPVLTSWQCQHLFPALPHEASHIRSHRTSCN